MRVLFINLVSGLLAGLFFFFSHNPASAQEKTILAPTGEYATIDMKPLITVIQTLQKGSDAEKAQAAKGIQSNPEKYAPPVFYILSETLFKQGDKDKAAFWFYAGQLRARYDAERCADVSARQAVAALNQHFGQPINQYMFENLPKLKALIPQVIEWDKKTPHDYDHRWINLSGMEAINGTADGSKPVLSLPENEWPAIAEKTRQNYLEGFHEALKMAQEQK